MKKKPVLDRERYGVQKIVYKSREIITYPFDVWLGRSHVILERGVDFSLEPKKMVQQIRNKANELKLTVSFKIHENYVSAVVWDRVEQERKNARTAKKPTRRSR